MGWNTHYDLDRRERVYSTVCSNPSVKSGILTFWIEEKLKATRQECPKTEDWINNSAAMERRVELNLGTMALSKTAESRCVGRQ